MTSTPVLIGLLAAAVLVVVLALWWVSRRSSASSELDGGGEQAGLAPPGAEDGSGEVGAAPTPSAEPAEPAAPGPGRLAVGLAKTRGLLIDRIDDLFRGRRAVDDDLWTRLEELLITSDIGVRTTTHLLEQMRATAERDALDDPSRLREHLRAGIEELLRSRAGSLVVPGPDSGPIVWVVVGVNGSGKTTTVGKLAARHTAQGHSVILAAGDTYRAAAIDQLEIWGKRAGAAVIRHDEGADPAAVAHDAVTAGIARGADLVICDTAGRLHTKSNLMAELSKVARVTGKVLDGAPHEVLLVLDATNGQNAIAQAREFAAAVGVTGIALTKLDGTARGGVIVAIAHELDIPVKLIGIGEGIEDLRDFDPALFLDALFGEPSEGFGRGSSSREASAADGEASAADGESEARPLR